MDKTLIVQIRSDRVRFLLYGFCAFMFVIVLRLFYLQIEQRRELASLGEKNFLRMEVVFPQRGDVFDCNHVLLAANRPMFDLYWQGKGDKCLSDQDKAMLKRVGSITDIDFLDEQRQINLAYAERFSRRVLLKDDLTFQQLCLLSEQCWDASHLVVSNRFKRVYPHHTLASHVLGYLHRGENIGRAGVERQLENDLQGECGCIVRIINSTGKMLNQTMSKEARAGVDITLTLDYKIQKFAESLFEADQPGALILMDAQTGAVRALVSAPSFDPNMFLKPLSEEDWGKISANNPLLNRATNASYPPASTFKIITWSAGLEGRFVDINSALYCKGYVTFHGRKYYCMLHSGHGQLNPKEALAHSCNIPCFNIGRKIKIDQLADYARRFGLGQKTNFLLPEKAGIVPTTVWKKETKKERWWPGETLSACIGQSYLLVTPLQVARMTAAICTGQLVRPRLLETESVEHELLAISQPTLIFLRNAMKETVLSGSGRLLSYLKDFDVYAKTGTAQTCSLSQEKHNRNQFEHGWFACYFYYKDRDPLVLVVLLENSGSSSFAVHVAEKFLRGYRALMEEHVRG